MISCTPVRHAESAGPSSSAPNSGIRRLGPTIVMGKARMREALRSVEILPQPGLGDGQDIGEVGARDKVKGGGGAGAGFRVGVGVGARSGVGGRPGEILG